MADRVTLEDIRTVHLIGAGGAGMSAIAKVLLARGMAVSGSDLKESRALAALRALGARIVVGHRGGNVDGADCVIVSSAIRPSNPELRAARERGLPVLHRAQVLALIMRGRRGIAVAGTHGKTTTTSMIALVLQRAGLDPSFLIGGDLNETGSNAHHGAGEWLVAEADESDGSFLWLAPEIAVVTNIEAEHLDHYRDEAEVRETFLSFLENLRADGAAVVCAEDPGVDAIAPRIGPRVVTYGIAAGEWRAEVLETGRGGMRVRVTRGGRDAAELRLSAVGRHNALNALAAIAAADLAGVPAAAAAAHLEGFQGVRRRFELRGELHGIAVVDDYAHHPTEVRATLEAARDSGYRSVLAVFQPHLYSRTMHLGARMGAALAGADLTVVTDVYGAREDPIPGVSGRIVVNGLLDAAPRGRVAYLPKRATIPEYVAARVEPGDCVLTIGAGDVTALGEEIMRAIARARGEAR